MNAKQSNSDKYFFTNLKNKTMTIKVKDRFELIKRFEEAKEEYINPGSAFSPEEKEKLRWLRVLRKVLIDDQSEIPPPEFLFCLNFMPSFARGSVTLVKGPAKSKKTYFLICLAGEFLFKKCGRIVWFDTEQSQSEANRVRQLIMKLSNGNGQLDYITLHDKNDDERKLFIQDYLKNENCNKDIDFLILDGIRDIVRDINVQTEAKVATQFIMDIARKNKLHVITVLHQNKNDSFARGALGTELTNKASLVISVTKNKKDPAMSYIQAEESRHKPFLPFAIVINSDDLPEMVVDGYLDSSLQSDIISPAEMDLAAHECIAEEVFKSEKELSYTPILEKIKHIFQSSLEHSIGDNKSKEMLKYWRENDVIVHNGQKGKNAKYTFNQK